MYYFKEEHQLFRASLRDFLKAEVLPHLNEWEEVGQLPKTIFQRFGEMGYFGLRYPEQYGGSAADIWYTVVLMEELSKVNSGGFGASIGAHPFLALTHIYAVGTEAQKAHYLQKGIAGELIGGLAITEPFGGSDVGAMRTTAERVGDHYIVNGSKTFITNGVSSDYLVVAVKTNTAAKHAGISLLIIDRDSAGFRARPLKKLGWHASDTGEISFDEVKVPVRNLLGAEGQGFLYIMQQFVLERLFLANGAIAASDHALEYTLQYMSERSAFGRPINKFQVLRHKIAQLASEVERTKYFIYHLWERFEKGDYIVKEASMAKLLGTQLSDRVMYDCLQCFGGYGFMEDYPMARMFRDSRLGTIGGGTSEIMCEIIAKMLIDGKGY